MRQFLLSKRGFEEMILISSKPRVQRVQRVQKVQRVVVSPLRAISFIMPPGEQHTVISERDK